MKKLVLFTLILMSVAAVTASGAQQKPGHKSSKKALAKAFAEPESDQQGVGFGLSLKHVEAGKFTAPGSIKVLQIFPINTVTGGFTYDFS